MAKPTHYTSKIAIPLPSEEAVRRIIGNSYNAEKTLNVIKMFAGTEDMYEATVALVKAIWVLSPEVWGRVRSSCAEKETRRASTAAATGQGA